MQPAAYDTPGCGVRYQRTRCRTCPHPPVSVAGDTVASMVSTDIDAAQATASPRQQITAADLEPGTEAWRMNVAVWA
jgi:hypothetical protein